MNRSLYLKRILLATVTLLALLVAELWMRQSVTPGMLWHLPWMNVDSLELYNDFVTDSSGILKLSSAASRKLQRLCHSTLEQIAKERFDITILYLMLSHCPRDIVEQVKWKGGALKQFAEHNPSPFADLVDSLRSGLKKPEDSVDLAYMNFMSDPINEDGFYSIPSFATIPQKRKRYCW